MKGRERKSDGGKGEESHKGEVDAGRKTKNGHDGRKEMVPV